MNPLIDSLSGSQAFCFISVENYISRQRASVSEFWFVFFAWSLENTWMMAFIRCHSWCKTSVRLLLNGFRTETWLEKPHRRRDLLHHTVFPAPEELRSIIQEVKYRTGLQSAKLIRQLRRRDRLHHKLLKNFDIITACLQAVSQKRRKNLQFLPIFCLVCLFELCCSVFCSRLSESLPFMSQLLHNFVFSLKQTLNCTQ